MGKLQEAKEVLKDLGLPKQQQNDRSAYTLLALLNLKEEDGWDKASNDTAIGIHEAIVFMKDNYNKAYAENSRETIRKDTIHQFIQAVVAEQNIDEAERATNSPNYRYQVTDEALNVIKSFGTEKWQKNVNSFIENIGSLSEKYAQRREMTLIPVKVNNQLLTFSPGKHNQLQKAIIENFAPRFAPGSEILYVGDTAKKDLVKNIDKLTKLGIKITAHDKLPDVVLYRKDKN